MPVQRCTKNGKSGWKWGSNGKCYVGNGAKAKAAKQGAAIKASGFQEHEIDLKMRSSNMLFQKIVTNFTGIVRNDTMEGRDYLVAPMIMIVEGVHEGSNGPLYYPAEELSKIPAVWNHKPIIVYHPESDDGVGISACDPDILTNRKIGVIMNASIDSMEVEINKKKVKIVCLKSEAWLEIDRMNIVDGRIAEAIEKNEVMELSTGLFTDNEVVDGDWHGESYTAIARNYRPDHLALLPDLVGACSIEDGAGFLRLNKAKDGFVLDITALDDKTRKCFLKNKESFVKIFNRSIIKTITENEISFEDVRQRLQSMLKEKLGDDEFVWVEDVFDDYFVYERAGDLHKQEYNDIDGSISFQGLPITVVKETNYPIKVNERKKIMKKKELIDALIKNEGTLWTEDDREDMMEFDEEILNKMSPIVKNEEEAVENKTEVAKAAEKGVVDIASKQKEDTKNEEDAVENMTAEEYIDKKVPNELQDVLRSGLASHNADKAKLITVITANEKNTFTKEQLEAKDLRELRRVASLAANTEKQQNELSNLNYTGQGDPIINDEEQEVLEVPVMNFG